MLSREALERLPKYVRYLKELHQKGVMNISSTVLAERFTVSPVQVRKDLAAVSQVSGKPKTGFCTADIIRDIEAYLGYNNWTEAILIGAGGLGRTLLGYNGFKNYGLNIVAAFDEQTDRLPDEVNGKKILSMDKLAEVVAKRDIRIGIITVPKGSAQLVCDRLLAAGIRAIWNFAPTHLVVPSGIAIKNEDLAASLALLSKELENLSKLSHEPEVD